MYSILLFFKNHTHAWRSRFLSPAVRYFSNCLPSSLQIYVRFSQLYPYPPPSDDYNQNQMMPNCFTSPQSGFPAEFTLSSTNCSSHRVHLSARLPPEKYPVNKPPSSSPAHFFSPHFFLSAKLNFSAITRCNSLPAWGTLKCKHNAEDCLSPQSCALSLRTPPGFVPQQCLYAASVSGNRGDNHPSRAEHSPKKKKCIPLAACCIIFSGRGKCHRILAG